MRVRPILFNTEMVVALLEGRKSCTRRKINREEAYGVLHSQARAERPEIEDRRFVELLVEAPYDAGDILYVRETWQVDPETHETVFRADYCGEDLREFEGKHFRWKPSIFMPKESARIFLQVTAIRAERLHEITAAECIREGVEAAALHQGGEFFTRGMYSDIWDSTMTAEQRQVYGWEANPWVWVIDFKPVERPAGF